MVSGDTAREADGTNLLTPCDLEEVHAVAGPTASRPPQKTLRKPIAHPTQIALQEHYSPLTTA
jgi:hypothetical protein